MPIGKEYKQCKDSSKECLSSNNLSISALQNLLFCIVKAALLQGKRATFGR